MPVSGFEPATQLMRNLAIATCGRLLRQPTHISRDKLGRSVIGRAERGSPLIAVRFSFDTVSNSIN